MPGLPRARDATRPRETFTILYLDAMERLTLGLRRGDPFSKQALSDMEALARRSKAFVTALEDRLELIEPREDHDG